MIEFTCEAIWPWDFVFLWEFWSQFWFLYVRLSVRYFCFFPVSLGRLICHFLPGCPFYWHKVAHSSVLWSFVFLIVCDNLSFFISNFVDLSQQIKVKFLTYISLYYKTNDCNPRFSISEKINDTFLEVPNTSKLWTEGQDL